MLAWSSRVSDPQRTKQKTRFFCVAWLKTKFVDRACPNTSGHVLLNKVPPRNWRLSNNVQLLFIFLPSYLPVCQLDPLAAKAQQIPAGGFYMSRLINVTCFRGGTRGGRMVQPGLFVNADELVEGANTCQSAVEVTRCLLLCPPLTLERWGLSVIWLKGPFFFLLLPPKSLRYRRRRSSEFRLRKRPFSVCLSLELPRQTPDAAASSLLFFSKDTHTKSQHFDPEKKLPPPPQKFSFFFQLFFPLNPAELAPPKSHFILQGP